MSSTPSSSRNRRYVQQYWNKFAAGGDPGAYQDWRNNWQNQGQDWLQDHPYAAGFGRGAMVAAGAAGTEYFQTQMHQRMTGQHDIMGEARSGGAFVGGLIGAGIGSLFANPFSPVI